MSDGALLAIGVAAIVTYLVGILPAVYIAARWGRAGETDAVGVGLCWPSWVAVQPLMNLLWWAFSPVGRVVHWAARRGQKEVEA